MALKGCRRGSYRLELQEIESVQWDQGQVRHDEAVKIVARTSGFPEGTAAELKVYEEFREDAGEEIGKASATIQGDQVSLTWRFDERSAGPPKVGERGVRRLVAELSLEGGKVWAKTPEPLQVELPTIEAVEWYPAELKPGEAATLVVRCLGFSEGTSVALELLRRDGQGADEPARALESIGLNGGEARLEVSYGGADGSQIQQHGAYSVVASIEGTTPRRRRSALLTCHVAGEEQADESS